MGLIIFERKRFEGYAEIYLDEEDIEICEAFIAAGKPFASFRIREAVHFLKGTTYSTAQCRYKIDDHEIAFFEELERVKQVKEIMTKDLQFVQIRMVTPTWAK